MNDKSSPPRPWRRALFLLPALLSAALIFYTLPRTQPVLAAVPELLEYQPTPTPAPKLYRDGVYTARGWCEETDNFRYEVIVTVTVEDGLICKVAIALGADESDYPEDNDYFIDRAINGTTKQKGVPAQIVAAQSADEIDGVSGATYTSNTIRSLVRDALREAKIGGGR